MGKKSQKRKPSHHINAAKSGMALGVLKSLIASVLGRSALGSAVQSCVSSFERRWHSAFGCCLNASCPQLRNNLTRERIEFVPRKSSLFEKSEQTPDIPIFHPLHYELRIPHRLNNLSLVKCNRQTFTRFSI
jgi:hypothetical protein